MRHSARRHRTVAAAVSLAAAMLLLTATVALTASVARETPGGLGAIGGSETLALGTITSFSPASVAAGSGSFALQMGLDPEASSGTTWTAQWNGPSGVFPLTVESTATASATIAVPAAAVSDTGHVVVSVSDGATAWSGGYGVTAREPHIDAILPDSAAAGDDAFTLQVTGSDFATGASPAYVTWNGVALASATPTGPTDPSAALYAAVPASAVLTPGDATVKVVNPLPGGGTHESNGVTFAIVGLSLAGITPATGANSESALSFVLTGTDMELAGPPIVVQLHGTGSNAGTVITATGVAYEPPGTPGAQGRIAGVFDLADITGAATPVAAPPGEYDVRMMFTNRGTKTLTLAKAFEVTGPSLTGVSPQVTTNGTSALTLTLSGTGLNTLASPAVTLRGPGTAGTTVVTATDVRSVAPGTTMACRFDLTSPVVVRSGTYDVMITYAGNKTLTAAQALTVLNAKPAVTAVNPDVVWAGSVKPATLTLTGTGFVPSLPGPGSSGSQVRIGTRLATTTTFVSETRLTVPLAAADVAAPGVVPVAVENPTPGGGISTPVWLTVGSDTSAPSTTISGADTAWHNRPATLSVTATDNQSGVQLTRWTQDGGSPRPLAGSTITVDAPAGGANDGYHVITVWSTDWCNHVENPPAAVTVRIDTVGPKTYAWAPSSVGRKAALKLRFRVNDLSPTCAVILKIKKANGTVARAYSKGQRASYVRYTYTVKPRLPKGRYTLYVYAKDLAGNRQTRLGTDTFRVK